MSRNIITHEGKRPTTHPRREARRERAADRAAWTLEQRRASVIRRMEAGHILNAREAMV